MQEIAGTSRRLRTREAAEYCGSTQSTFEKKRVSGGGPSFIKVGRTVVYDTADLDAYLASRRRRSTSGQ
jgi:predicted DNA-binding transcriptional regulator AlpA